MSLQVFNYNDSPISFLQGDDIWISANEMAKPFNKTPAKWLELISTKAFISQLSNIRQTDIDKLRYTERGGTNAGTWFCKDVAAEFARWLSPSLAIWCNDRIIELAKHGLTASNDTLEELAANPDLLEKLAQTIRKERAEKVEAQMARVEAESREREAKLSLIDKEEQLVLANQTIVHQAPDYNYAQEVLKGKGLIPITIIAKQLGTGPEKLNIWLHQQGVQYKKGKLWYLYDHYVGKGLADYKTHPRKNSNGDTVTELSLQWTEKGRKMIIEMYTSFAAASAMLSQQTATA